MEDPDNEEEGPLLQSMAGSVLKMVFSVCVKLVVLLVIIFSCVFSTGAGVSFPSYCLNDERERERTDMISWP